MPVPVSAPAKTKKIRVMVVDDSIVARNLLITGLSAHPLIEVVGYAINALDAKNKLPRLKPDVMTLDVEMPGESGLDLLKELLPTHPIPVILVSSLNLRVFDALAAGAVDFVRKPEANQSRDAFLATLAQKIVVAAHARVHPAPAGVRQPQPTGPLRHHPLARAGPSWTGSVIGLGCFHRGHRSRPAKCLRQLPADIPRHGAGAAHARRFYQNVRRPPEQTVPDAGAGGQKTATRWSGAPCWWLRQTCRSACSGMVPATIPSAASPVKKFRATAPRWIPCSFPWPKWCATRWWASS